MKKLVNIFILLIGLANLSELRAADNKSITLYIGEALMPSDLRLGIGSIDFGISTISYLYLGTRERMGNAYVGVGLSLLNQLGLYGLVGYQRVFWDFYVLNAEFKGSGHANGDIAALGLLGIGVTW